MSEQRRNPEPPGDHTPSPLDRYLDGLMSSAEAASFEAQLATDESLRLQVELQRQIDQRLHAMFTPPGRIELPTVAPAPAAADTAPIPIRPRRTRLVALAAAAAIALLVGGAAYWWFAIGVAAPFRQPAQIYQTQLASNFTPEWVCTTDEEFIRTVRDRFGEPALLPLATQGVQIVGWAYNTPVLSNKTATLMTRVDGREVLVLIDDADKDVNLRRPGEAGQTTDLNLFKRRLGGLVLYEVTPLDHATVIPSFTRGE